MSVKKNRIVIDPDSRCGWSGPVHFGVGERGKQFVSYLGEKMSVTATDQLIADLTACVARIKKAKKGNP